MKRRGFTFVEVIAVSIVACILLFVFFPAIFYRRHPETPLRATCQSQLKQIGLGFRQYTQDWDEKYPLISVNDVTSSLPLYKTPFGWADALQRYTKSTEIFHCRSEEDKTLRSEDAVQTGFTDYWMNSNLAGLSEAGVESVAMTILCGDGSDGIEPTDARYSHNNLPSAWRKDEKIPAYRHVGGANYAFADGHVKWFKGEVKIYGNNLTSTSKPKKGDVVSFTP